MKIVSINRLFFRESEIKFEERQKIELVQLCIRISSWQCLDFGKLDYSSPASSSRWLFPWNWTSPTRLRFKVRTFTEIFSFETFGKQRRKWKWNPAYHSFRGGSWFIFHSLNKPFLNAPKNGIFLENLFSYLTWWATEEEIHNLRTFYSTEFEMKHDRDILSLLLFSFRRNKTLHQDPTLFSNVLGSDKVGKKDIFTICAVSSPDWMVWKEMEDSKLSASCLN